MRRFIMIGLLVSLLWGTRAGAQLPVTDAANLVPNTIAATQSIISAVQAVIQTSRWIIDQTPLESFLDGGELAGDLATMTALVQEAQALGYDVAQLRALSAGLFSLESAPDNSYDYQLRMMEIRRHVSTAWSYSLRTQALIVTAQRTISHILQLYEQMSGLLGNLGGQQHLSQELTKLVQIETEAKVSTHAFQLAQSLDKLTEPMTLEYIRKFNANVSRTIPRAWPW